MRNLILGIESSCDDSSLAVMDIDSYEAIFYSKISQETKHSKYGGVVPELAARLHTAALPEILEKAGPFLKELKAVCVTNEPGLSVSLVGGVSMAKTLSVVLNLPLIAINHLVGHIYSLFLDKNADFPLGILLVSGGHTMVLDIDEFGKINIILTTTDDSFGESFDKVAKMMNLGYPGGLIIENLAKKTSKDEFNFTVPLLHSKRLEYSFSGLKNQVRLEIEKFGENITDVDKQNIAYSFQNAAISHIMDKLNKVFEVKKWSKFGVVGGASANLELRKNLENLCDKYNSKLLLAPLQYCADNALMIARAGIEKYRKKDFTDYKKLQIQPKLDLKKI